MQAKRFSNSPKRSKTFRSKKGVTPGHLFIEASVEIFIRFSLFLA